MFNKIFVYEISNLEISFKLAPVSLLNINCNDSDIRSSAVLKMLLLLRHREIHNKKYGGIKSHVLHNFVRLYIIKEGDSMCNHFSTGFSKGQQKSFSPLLELLVQDKSKSEVTGRPIHSQNAAFSNVQ